MRPSTFFLVFVWAALSCVGVPSVYSQSTYHDLLQAQLLNEHGLSGGEWVFYGNEQDNINQAFSYGAQYSVLNISDQDFTKAVQEVVAAPGTNQWDAGWGLHNVNSIQAGDKLLLVVWIRRLSESGKVSLFFEDRVTFAKEVYYTLPLQAGWRQYLVPFEASKSYAAGGATAGFHLAHQAQQVQFGGWAVLNFRNRYRLEDLPESIGNDQYGGYEPDAPWRAAAAARIDSLRKAGLSIQLQDENGNPLPGVEVSYSMLQHEYAFGSAVVACKFAGNSCQDPIYEQKLTNLDGKGHGFNWVVFENALKWRAWEGEWPATKAEKVHATQWLKDRNIHIRGHNLLWPGWSYLPQDIVTNGQNPSYIKNRIQQHLNEILTYPGIKGNIAEWDVLNEITTNRDLENAFRGSAGYPTGRELYVEVFNQTTQLAPEAKTYLNDYITISLANQHSSLYETYKGFIRELLDAGVRLDGIGFQAHIGGFPTSIPLVYDILEDFYQEFGTKAKITEYDTDPSMNDSLAGVYLRDFMTMVFSHPSTEGFLMWGFWDGAHWHDNAPMYDINWQLKPAGQAFIDLVFKQWWTQGSLVTDSAGRGSFRGFKGTYAISYSCDGARFTDTLQLSQDTTLSLSCLSTARLPASRLKVAVYPNPARDRLTLRHDETAPLELRLLDMQGRLLHRQQLTQREYVLPLQLPPGLYVLHLRSPAGSYRQKLWVR
ncbi:MAG: T9SS C-terminal target domain-containing protein [Bacteroidetes bacterium]|nr:MAG: T9SS C-terminal target domain-containing protein [Bacteroidota bacterium]